MAVRFVEVADVRAACGISVSFISDADFTGIIEQQEYEVESFLNTTCTPTTVLERYDGNGTERLVLRKNPILKIRAINIDGTDVTMEYVRLDEQAGIIYLTTGGEASVFKKKDTEKQVNRIKFDWAYLEPTKSQTTSSAAVIAGDSIAITVADSSDFSVDDYVEITGMDAMYEVAKITTIADGTHITADNLSQPHESGSVITKMDVPPLVKRLMIVNSAIAGVARVVGQSFDEITGYSVSDVVNVQKGEPYTQWRETSVQLVRERKEILKRLRPRPSVG